MNRYASSVLLRAHQTLTEVNWDNVGNRAAREYVKEAVKNIRHAALELAQ